MSFYITFDNGKTDNSFGMYLAERPSIPITSNNTDYIQIPGSDGYLTRKDGFQNRSIQLKYQFNDKSNLIGKVRPFVAQLRNSKSFFFSDDPSVEYRMVDVSFDNIEREVRILGTLTVNVVLEPFCYYRNIATIDGKVTSIITNIGDYLSRPHMKITCNGTVTNQQIVVNNLIVKFKSITDFIEIDSQVRRCYKNSYSANMGDKVEANDYPIFNVGVNNIQVSSGITHVYINPRWRCF